MIERDHSTENAFFEIQIVLSESLRYQIHRRLLLQGKTDTSAVLEGMDYEVINIGTVLEPRQRWLNCNYSQKFPRSGCKQHTI